MVSRAAPNDLLQGSDSGLSSSERLRYQLLHVVYIARNKHIACSRLRANGTVERHMQRML
jgi:hypothetical protein